MEYTVLLAEDQAKLRNVVRNYFVDHGVGCDLARDGAEALDLLRDHQYDAVVLDVLMPNLDGFAVCKAIRTRSGVPVIFLTALGDEGSILRGYELGCDDYVSKPFSLAVLLAKTLTLIKRSRGMEGGGALKCGAILLHTGSRTVTVNGTPVELTPRGFDLLECLIRNPGQAMRRCDLLDQVWGIDFEGDDRAVDVQVKNLRAALGSAGGQIKTVYKTGYKLTGEG